MPLVSIIIPNYNHCSFLEQRIESVLNQTFQDFEIILLDDASTDGSQDILKKYLENPLVSCYIENTKNSGSPFKQWQKGISLAKGDYIWIAESDDFTAATFLEITVNRLNNESDICYVQSQDVDEHGKVLSHRIEYTKEFDPNIWENNFTLEGKEFLVAYLSHKNVIPNASAVVFKKSLVEPSIFSDSLLNMKMCGDWFFWIQLSKDAKISFVSEPLNFFRIHKNVSRQHKSIQKKKLRILEEVSCRNYLYRNFSISIPKKNKNLINNWCRLFSKWAPFKKEFYGFKLFNINSISLLLNFVSVKLKSK